MAITWKGIYPALTTKFTKDDTLDLLLFEKNLKAQIDTGIGQVLKTRKMLQRRNVIAVLSKYFF